MIMSIDLLLLDAVGQISAGDVPAPAAGYTPTAPLEQPWLLLAAVALWTISIILLYQSGRFHLWVAAKVEEGPNPLFGFVMACLSSLLTVVLSFLYLTVRYPPLVDNRRDLGAVLAWYFLNHPSEFGAGVLLSSIVPSAVAIYTFAMAGFIMRDTGQESPPLSRSPKAALVGAIFSSISLAGSIATLIMFFSWINNP
jgi:hypothetical protein